MRIRGFTLVELMITIAVVAILLVVGVPSYSYVTANVRMSNELSALLGDIQYARSEAEKEGVNVVICASSNQKTCNTSAWQNGWIIYSTVSTPIKIKQAFTGTETFSANGSTSQITFNREGFPNAADTFVLRSSNNDPRLTRCLAITIVGQLTTMVYNAGQNCI